ncbi:MAG: ferritin family protein [bacterium]
MKKKAKKKIIKKVAKKKAGKLDIDELLLSALGAELMAMEFYSKAAQKARSETGRNLFRELAEFEQKHYEHIKEIIESRQKGKTIALAPIAPFDKMIKPEVSGEFEPNKDEIIDVLNIGIKAEKQAQERYKKIAEQIEDKKVKQIFINLSEDERRHLNILENELYQLANKGTIIWE